MRRTASVRRNPCEMKRKKNNKMGKSSVKKMGKLVKKNIINRDIPELLKEKILWLDYKRIPIHDDI